MNKLRSIFTFFLLSTFSFTATAQSFSFMHDGVLRDYNFRVPSGYDGSTALPLVINMHGYTSNASQQEFYSNMTPIAEEQNFFVVYPNGIGNAWNVGFPGVPFVNGVDDVGFINALIDTLTNNYLVDLTRVYSTGMSNGGYMSYRLACELNDRITAIASVTGSMNDSMRYHCYNPQSIPVLEIHGTDDPTVPYDGSTFSHSIDTVMKFWWSQNVCDPIPAEVNLPDNDLNDGATITSYTWSNCEDSALVVLYKVINGEHTWPGAPITIGVTCDDINGSRAIWEFFSQFPEPLENPTSTIDKEQIETVELLTNPITDRLVLRLLSPEATTIKLIDMQGRVLINHQVAAGIVGRTAQLVNPGIRSGNYLLEIIAGKRSQTHRVMKI